MQWGFLTTAGTVLAGVIVASALAFRLLIARVVRAENAAVSLPFTGPLDRVEHGSEATGIVVFGATTYASGPSRELAARLRHAMDIWAFGHARVIAVSGGTADGLDEVSDMAAFLKDMGVPATAVVEARPGGNTRQTFTTMRRIGTHLNIERWIAVSTPFHARRIRDEARRAGLDVVVSGPADSPEMMNSRVHRARIITEAIATCYYAMPACVTTRIRTSKGSWRHRFPRALARRPWLRNEMARTAQHKGSQAHHTMVR